MTQEAYLLVTDENGEAVNEATPLVNEGNGKGWQFGDCAYAVADLLSYRGGNVHAVIDAYGEFEAAVLAALNAGEAQGNAQGLGWVALDVDGNRLYTPAGYVV